MPSRLPVWRQGTSMFGATAGRVIITPRGRDLCEKEVSLWMNGANGEATKRGRPSLTGIPGREKPSCDVKISDAGTGRQLKGFRDVGPRAVGAFSSLRFTLA